MAEDLDLRIIQLSKKHRRKAFILRFLPSDSFEIIPDSMRRDGGNRDFFRKLFTMHPLFRKMGRQKWKRICLGHCSCLRQSGKVAPLRAH